METYVVKKRDYWFYTRIVAEPILTIVVGSIFYFHLKNELIGSLVWIVGSYLSLNNALSIITTREEMGKIKSELRESNTVCGLNLSVEDEDYEEIKNEKLLDYISFLKQLKEGTAKINGNAYYSWLNNQVDKCGKVLYAISAMQEANWINDCRERTFYDHNVQAQKRGVKVNRIFITTVERMNQRINREIIIKHVEDNMESFVIYLSDITDQQIKPIAEKGFLVLDDRIAFSDLEPPSETVGIAMKNKNDIRQYMKWYNQLAIQATPGSVFLLHLFQQKINEYANKYKDISELRNQIAGENRNNIKDQLQDELDEWTAIIKEKERVQHV